MVHIIALTGVPGVGKSSVAKRLQKEGYKVKSDKDFFENCGLGGNPLQLDMYCVEKNMPDYVIFESHTSHLIDCDHVIHLKLSDYGELRKRLKLRGYVSDKIQSNVDSEIFEVISDEISCLNRIEIETQNKSIEQVFLEVLNYIESIAQHKMYKDF